LSKYVVIMAVEMDWVTEEGNCEDSFGVGGVVVRLDEKVYPWVGGKSVNASFLVARHVSRANAPPTGSNGEWFTPLVLTVVVRIVEEYWDSGRWKALACGIIIVI
jgi:hypothetical protein